jgi:hypothetical protein
MNSTDAKKHGFAVEMTPNGSSADVRTLVSFGVGDSLFTRLLHAIPAGQLAALARADVVLVELHPDRVGGANDVLDLDQPRGGDEFRCSVKLFEKSPVRGWNAGSYSCISDVYVRTLKFYELEDRAWVQGYIDGVSGHDD